MQGVNDLEARELEVILKLVSEERARLPDKAPAYAIEVARDLDSVEAKVSLTLRAADALARFRAIL